MPPIPVPRQAYIDTERRANGMKKRKEKREKLETRHVGL